MPKVRSDSVSPEALLAKGSAGSVRGAGESTVRSSLAELAPEDASPVEAPAKSIHFVTDGFTMYGQVWLVGQELDFTQAEYDAIEPDPVAGKRWVDLTIREQIRRYGKQVFGEGRWPGEDWPEEAAAAEAARNRRVPRTLPIAGLTPEHAARMG